MTPEGKAAHAKYQREHRWKHRYGITPDDYERMLEAQGGGCAICGAPQGHKDGRRLHVDHDHETGEVRGLLCGLCNHALGRLDSVGVERFLFYLDW